MGNSRVVPICINRELLLKIDTEVVKVYSKKNKGRSFNRSAFICDALEYYLDNFSYKIVKKDNGLLINALRGTK